MPSNDRGTAALQLDRYRPLILLTVLALGLFGPRSSYAAEEKGVIALPETGYLADLKKQARYLPDPEGEYTAEELFDGIAAFQPYDPAWESSAPPMWIRLSLEAPPDSAKRYYLTIKRRFFQELDVYIDTGSGSVQEYHSGIEDYRPTHAFAQSFFYPFSPDQSGQVEILIHFRVVQARLGPLTLAIQDEVAFESERSTGLWAYGLYFGAMLALIFYNFVLYLNLRTPGHRWYVGAMVSVLIFMGLDSGLLQGKLPMLIRTWEPLLYVLAAALMPAATARFFQVFVGASFYTPFFHKFISWLVATLSLVALAAVVAPLAAALFLAIIVQLVTSLIWITLSVASLVAAVRGSRAGWIFFAAWSAFVLGVIFRALLSADLIQRVPAAEYSLYIGSIMEAMILALGLSYRVGRLRTQRNRAMREQQRAARLANIDPLTGAYNRRFIENYLDGLLDSGDRRAFHGSLIMLDMDNFKPVNDQYGHAAGDTVLQEMARRCLGILRAEDVLARLGGDEFAVVLPDQSGEQARSVAEKIRAEIAGKPVNFGMQPIDMSVSIGIVTRFESGATAYSAFKHADQALYQAKRAGRNRVVLFTGGSEAMPA